MDESWKYYAKENKSVTDKQPQLYNSIYMKYPE